MSGYIGNNATITVNTSNAAMQYTHS